MDNGELIAKLCNEAAKSTPDVYKKIIKSAKAQGLLSTGGTGGSSAGGSQAPRGTGGSGSVKAATADAFKRYFITTVATLLAVAVAVAAVAIPIANSVNNGTGEQITAPDNGANTDSGANNGGSTGGNGGGSQTPATPANPDQGNESGTGTEGGNESGSQTPPTEPETPETPVTPVEPVDPTPPEEEEIIENPENYTKEGVYYELCEDGKSYRMTGFNHLIPDLNLVLPAYYEGKPITEIADKLDTVGSTYLKSVTVPKTVKKIGSNAFINCSKLAEINLPDSLTEIGKDAFKGTKYYDDRSNWDNGVLYIGNYLVAAQPSWLIWNEGNAYTERIKVPETYNIKAGTRLIANGAFRSMDSANPVALKTVTFPDGLQYIGKNAFYLCEALTEINLPDSVKRIEEYAFAACKITKLKMSASIEYIGDQAFSSSFIGGELRFAEGLTYIGDYAFTGSNITALSVPDTVKYIGAHAFSSNSLEELDLGNGVQYIGEGAFIGCSKISRVVIPASVRVIGPFAFSRYDGGWTEMVFEDANDWKTTYSIYAWEQGNKDVPGGISPDQVEECGEFFTNLILAHYGQDFYDDEGRLIAKNILLYGLYVERIYGLEVPENAALKYNYQNDRFWLRGFWD